MAEAALTATTEKRRSGANVVKLKGVLGGNAGLHTIDIGTTPRLMVNLGQIERIDDQTEWARWIASIIKRNVKVELVSCSPVVVAELNRSVDFAGAAVVKSVSIPFRCPTCESTTEVLATIIDLRETKMAPNRECDLCKSAMEMTDHPAQYFAFVDKLTVTESSPNLTTQAPTRPSQSRIARGSNQSVAPQNRGSRPSGLLLERRSSMSAFQLSSRGSNPDMATGSTPGSEPVSRGYWIAAIVLLALAAGVLAVLLMVM